MIITAILVCVFFAVIAQTFYLRILAKHDRALFPFCEIRRKVYRLMVQPEFYEDDTNYSDLHRLLRALDMTIHNYVPLKKELFNLRKFKQHLYQLEDTTKRFDSLSDKEEIRHLQREFVKAWYLAFFTYTPFIEYEVVFKVVILTARALARIGIEWAYEYKEMLLEAQSRKNFYKANLLSV